MSVFEKVTIDEVRTRTMRRTKTSPLREQILAMELGDAIFVPFYNPETGEGFKQPTINQVAGNLGRDSAELRYCVRKDMTRNGAFVVCMTREGEGKKRGPKPRK
jgi:hypothetical protein